MPLTPFHLGPGLFFGTIFLKYIDFLAFLLGSVVLDVEPFFIVLRELIEKKDYAHHQFFHTILGAFLASLVASFILNKFQNRIRKEFKRYKLFQKIGFSKSSSFSKIFFSVFSGAILHLLFDALMHYDVFPFWPSKYNPLLRKISFMQNYYICTALGILGIILLIFYLRKKK